jgi:hypothetical protein
VACECDVVDGEPASRLVNYPLAGHYPELADVWPRRGNGLAGLSAHRIAVIPGPGQGRVVVGDESLGVRECHRVHRDKGTGSRSEHRVARPAAGTAALPRPLLPGQPQIPLGIKSCHVSILPQQMRRGSPSCSSKDQVVRTRQRFYITCRRLTVILVLRHACQRRAALALCLQGDHHCLRFTRRAVPANNS